jgi:hypothetical protein
MFGHRISLNEKKNMINKIAFGGRIKLEYKRLHHPSIHPAAEGDLADPVFF